MANENSSNFFLPRALIFCDQLGAVIVNPEQNSLALWANRSLILGVILFALSLPHSIAASYISLSLCHSVH